MEEKDSLISDKKTPFSGVSLWPDNWDFYPPIKHRTIVRCKCPFINISKAGVYDITALKIFRVQSHEDQPIYRIRIFDKRTTKLYTDPRNNKLYFRINGIKYLYHHITDCDLFVECDEDCGITEKGFLELEINSRTILNRCGSFVYEQCVIM